MNTRSKVLVNQWTGEHFDAQDFRIVEVNDHWTFTNQLDAKERATAAGLYGKRVA